MAFEFVLFNGDLRVCARFYLFNLCVCVSTNWGGGRMGGSNENLNVNNTFLFGVWVP